MICKKCKAHLKMRGEYLKHFGMFVDWWECPKCDNENEEEMDMDKKIKALQKTTKKLEKGENELLKADKKRDKTCAMGAKMMAKKKK